jgi:hypothetical protein
MFRKLVGLYIREAQYRAITGDVVSIDICLLGG